MCAYISLSKLLDRICSLSSGNPFAVTSDGNKMVVVLLAIDMNFLRASFSLHELLHVVVPAACPYSPSSLSTTLAVLGRH